MHIVIIIELAGSNIQLQIWVYSGTYLRKYAICVGATYAKFVRFRCKMLSLGV